MKYICIFEKTVLSDIFCEKRHNFIEINLNRRGISKLSVKINNVVAYLFVLKTFYANC